MTPATKEPFSNEGLFFFPAYGGIQKKTISLVDSAQLRVTLVSKAGDGLAGQPEATTKRRNIMSATAELKGKKLIITLDVEETVKPSQSGKTLVVASTHGNAATSAQYDGKPVIIGVNAFIKP